MGPSVSIYGIGGNGGSFSALSCVYAVSHQVRTCFINIKVGLNLKL